MKQIVYDPNTGHIAVVFPVFTEKIEHALCTARPFLAGGGPGTKLAVVEVWWICLDTTDLLWWDWLFPASPSLYYNM